MAPTAGGTPCDRVLAETDGTGAAGTKREYIWLGDMPVAVIDKAVTPNKTLMVYAAHLNRPYFMMDSTRAVVFKAVYEPFGAVYSTTGTATLNTLRFPGQWFQLESGLAYNWHRHYDATLGRYVSADPLGLVDGASVYGYVGQRPTRKVDPTGLDALIVVGGQRSDSNNVLGHVSLGVTGAGIFSFGTGHRLGGSVTDFLAEQRDWRDQTLIRIPTTPEQDAKMVAFLRQQTGPLGLMADNCADRTYGALLAAGIQPYGKWWNEPRGIRYPSSLGGPAFQSFPGAKTYSIPRASSISADFSSFNPR